MTSKRYQKISSLGVRKGKGNRPFYIEASTAVRLSDGARGLLLQHQQKTRFGPRKQGFSFFVRQQDIPGFLYLIAKLLQDNVSDFGPWAERNIKESPLLTSGARVFAIRKELEDMEKKLGDLTPDMEREIQELRDQIAAKDTEIDVLTTDLHKVRQQRRRIWIKQMERSVPMFRERLEELRRLVKEGREIAKLRNVKQETLYQDFLEENFWMFGMPYISVKGQRRSSTSDVPDLLLQRTDGFNDVVELENPTDRLFIEKSGRYEQSAELKEALAQIMDYLDDYAVRYYEEYYEDGLDTYKPKGIVVIGRSGERDLERRRRQLNSYLHGIEIWTYDDLVNNAERIITLLERGPMAQVLDDLCADDDLREHSDED
jgi:ribosomal protein S30